MKFIIEFCLYIKNKLIFKNKYKFIINLFINYLTSTSIFYHLRRKIKPKFIFYPH